MAMRIKAPHIANQSSFLYKSVNLNFSTTTRSEIMVVVEWLFSVMFKFNLVNMGAKVGRFLVFYNTMFFVNDVLIDGYKY